MLLEEIIVTAQKREQNLQDVGISITAFSGEQMEKLGYSNAQEVTSMAPGVNTLQPNGEANYAVAIRGVATSDFTTNVESPVAMYLDEVYISQMSGAGFRSSTWIGSRSCAARRARCSAATRPAASCTSSRCKPTRNSRATRKARSASTNSPSLEGAIGWRPDRYDLGALLRG